MEEDVESIGEGKVRFKTPPFLLTLEILNHKVHNCLVDSGSSVNVMPLTVCKKINGQPKPTAWEVTQLDRTSVKVVGDILDGYGLILNRDWFARLKGYFASDWSHL